MNSLSIILLGVLIADASAQSTFQNLDFESAKLTSPGIEGNPVDQALPNWQVYLNGQPSNFMGYDSRTLDLWDVELQDGLNPPYSFQPISGQYSVYVRGGRRGFPDNAIGPAAIAQIGALDQNAHSVLFAASLGVPVVSFNGQTLSVFEIQNHDTYNTYGADISPFAGQTGELKFTTLGESLIDDIQFSVNVIPEPGTFAMLTTGSLLLIALHRHKAR